MPPRTLQYTLLISCAAGTQVFGYAAIQAVVVPGETEAIELWKVSGLAGLALASTIGCLSIIKWLVGEVLMLAKQQAANMAQLNGQLESLVLELRNKTISYKDYQNQQHQEQTPLGNKILESSHGGH